MSNILDYLKWRGDLSFANDPLNEVDALILSQLSMLKWENALTEEDSEIVGNLYESMNQDPVSVGFTTDSDLKLWQLVPRCERFGRLRVSRFRRLFDAKKALQFAAITLKLPDGSAFVSFRGTDSTLIGWREDFNMAFSKPVPAQEAAQAYLDEVGRTFEGPLRVGGHSKGGNLAMYAAATADEAVRERILGVYNNDGPGLSDRMDAEALYQRITGRLHSCVPQGSIVGMLLNHPDEYTVVKSNSVSILQHDPYSWQVEGPAFVRMPALSRDSARFDAAFRAWLASVDEANRALLVDTLFNVLSAAKSPTFGREFWIGLARNPVPVFNAIQDVDADERRRINRMLTDLGAALRRAGDFDA